MANLKTEPAPVAAPPISWKQTCDNSYEIALTSIADEINHCVSTEAVDNGFILKLVDALEERFQAINDDKETKTHVYGLGEALHGSHAKFVGALKLVIDRPLENIPRTIRSKIIEFTEQRAHLPKSEICPVMAQTLTAFYDHSRSYLLIGENIDPAKKAATDYLDRYRKRKIAAEIYIQTRMVTDLTSSPDRAVECCRTLLGHTEQEVALYKHNMMHSFSNLRKPYRTNADDLWPNSNVAYTLKDMAMTVVRATQEHVEKDMEDIQLLRSDGTPLGVSARSLIMSNIDHYCNYRDMLQGMVRPLVGAAPVQRLR